MPGLWPPVASALCPAFCVASGPAKRSSKLSFSSIWTASTAAAWAGGKTSAPPPSNATSSAVSSASSRRWHPAACPVVLGIDEHFFTRRRAMPPPSAICAITRSTTWCWAARNSLWRPIYRACKAKTRYGSCAWIWPRVYRSLVRKHFPNARIVADRFHVIRIINHHFLTCWKELDPVGSRNRGLLSLMRRHRHNLKPEQQPRWPLTWRHIPPWKLIYRFKQRLCYLLLKKHRNRKQCEPWRRAFCVPFSSCARPVCRNWSNSAKLFIAGKRRSPTMWRFTRNNGITEGFHNKMELISRQAYGFRNFENYRMRVKVLCFLETGVGVCPRFWRRALALHGTNLRSPGLKDALPRQ